MKGKKENKLKRIQYIESKGYEVFFEHGNNIIICKDKRFYQWLNAHVDFEFNAWLDEVDSQLTCIEAKDDSYEWCNGTGALLAKMDGLIAEGGYSDLVKLVPELRKFLQ